MDTAAVQALLDQHAELESRLADPSLHADPDAARKVGRRYGELSRIVRVVRELDQARNDMAVARELASRNITANAVAPGYIETAMTESLAPELKEDLLKAIPLGRIGKESDVASAVCFLASEEAAYITGHVLRVNGGMLMG